MLICLVLLQQIIGQITDNLCFNSDKSTNDDVDTTTSADMRARWPTELPFQNPAVFGKGQ